MSELKLLKAAEAVIAQNKSDGMEDDDWLDAEDIRIENLTETDIEFLIACNPALIRTVLSQLDKVRGIPMKLNEPENSRFQRGWIAGWNGFYDELQQALQEGE